MSVTEVQCQSFFQNALREAFGEEEIDVLLFKRKCDSLGGANFLSDIFRELITYRRLSSRNRQEETIQVVVKTEPQHASALDTVREQGIFETELKILRYVLPRMEELLDEQLGPTLFYGCAEPKVIVMEDLSVRGFSMKDRQAGLDETHVLLALESLAKFHATSVALHEKDPGLIEQFKVSIVSSNCHVNLLKILGISLLNLEREVLKWRDDDTGCREAADKLHRLAGEIAERIVRVYDYEADEFCVLNHGDTWATNFLFKDDCQGDDGASECKMVDFQMSIYSSPAIDLIYFLNITPSVDLKCERDDYFLSHYLRVLSSTMRAIGCKTQAPTLPQLKASMLKRRIFSVMAGLIFYPRMSADAEDTEDFSNVLATGVTKMNVFKNKNVVRALGKLIPYMNKNGYLD